MNGSFKIQFYQALIFIMIISSRGLAGNSVLCHAFYLKPMSIEFGLLFRKAKDIETIEALNEQSKELMFGQESPNALDHLINTLLYYKALMKFLAPDQLEGKFQSEQYQIMYSAVKAEVSGSHKKFNYFRKYLLLETDRPALQLVPAVYK